MAAYDVHAGRLFGSVADKTGILPFMTLADRVMSMEPYRSARTVFWVVDNGSSHNGKRSIDRMSAAWPNAILIHLPVHASWLNLIEIVFSVIQRARSSSPPASLTSPNWPTDWCDSRTATTPPPPRSGGGSAPPTWPGSSSSSTSTGRHPPVNPPPPEAAMMGR